MNELKHSGSQYVSHSSIWESQATIRSRPRRQLEDDNLQYFPLSRQPLCANPAIEILGNEVQNYILIQSLYKYLNDIIIFETEVVIKIAHSIAKRNFPFNFPFSCRHDAMSVVIDENYHAYVAMDYINQVQEKTSICPIELPADIELSRAIPRALESIPEAYQDGLELIAVAISENTVTAEVAAFSRETSLKRSIKGLMADHLADEGRHSIFWINLVKIYWKEISEDARVAIGLALPTFIHEYLKSDLQADFEQRLVLSIAMPALERRKLLEQIVSTYPITRYHPMISNIVKFFKLSGLLNHEPTRYGLKNYL